MKTIQYFLFLSLCSPSFTNFAAEQNPKLAQSEQKKVAKCLICTEKITDPYDPTKNQSHFNCAHTNQYCLDCIHALFFKKVKKECPQCHADGKLFVRNINVPTTNTLKINCLATTDEFSKYSFEDEDNTAIFKWKRASPNMIFLNKEGKKEQPIPLALITRWATVASKNPDMFKKYYIAYRNKMSKEADSELTTSFSLSTSPLDLLLQKVNICRVLCLLSDHPGSLEPLIKIFRTLHQK